MHRRSFLFSAAFVPIDFFVVAAAGIGSWYLRFAPGVRRIWPIIFDLTFREYLFLALGAAILSIVFLAAQGLYNPRLKISFAATVYRIGVSQTMVLAAIALGLFLRQELFCSRFLVFAAWRSLVSCGNACGSFLRLRKKAVKAGKKGATKVLL